jgi:hypothetical protein
LQNGCGPGEEPGSGGQRAQPGGYLLGVGVVELLEELDRLGGDRDRLRALTGGLMGHREELQHPGGRGDAAHGAADLQRRGQPLEGEIGVAEGQGDPARQVERQAGALQVVRALGDFQRSQGEPLRLDQVAFSQQDLGGDAVGV